LNDIFIRGGIIEIGNHFGDHRGDGISWSNALSTYLKLIISTNSMFML